VDLLLFFNVLAILIADPPNILPHSTIYVGSIFVNNICNKINNVLNNKKPSRK
jgi:hypothetical protein